MATRNNCNSGRIGFRKPGIGILQPRATLVQPINRMVMIQVKAFGWSLRKHTVSVKPILTFGPIVAVQIADHFDSTAIRAPQSYVQTPTETSSMFPTGYPNDLFKTLPTRSQLGLIKKHGETCKLQPNLRKRHQYTNVSNRGNFPSEMQRAPFQFTTT